ncbi:MAG: sugar phosphate isomerase/epimerase [Desulfobacterales bacterium]|nr:sugar phosphate isomerase/epimerase [Desulfobacterales bacterium]
MAIIGGRAHSIEHVKAIVDLGYPFAEICLYDPDKVIQEMKDFMDIKQNNDIYYLAHYPNEDSPSDPDMLRKKYLPKMKRLIDLSTGLDIKKGTIHFWIDKRWAKPSLINDKLEILGELVKYATAQDVIICIENLSEQYDSFKAATDMIQDLRITLDIGHGQLLSNENTSIDFVKHLFNKIEHVHVHDNFGGKSVKDDLHLPLGEGDVDYPKIFTMLKDNKYDSTITMEVTPDDMPKTKKLIERYI